MSENKEYLLLKAKRIITERTQSSYLPDEFIGAEKESETLLAILDDAILNKKSTVGLITGPKGSGKSSFFKHCLRKYNESDYLLVRLSGMIHFNDNYALKEIAKALNIQIPSGLGTYDTFEFIRVKLGKETLESQINTSTKKKELQSLPVVILIEELELMLTSLAASKQSLFYNLLDLSHYKNVSLSFIATTSHLDIVDMFEKRIKSRFTQESIKIPPLSFESIQIIFKNLISLPKSFDDEEYRDNWNTHVEKSLKSKSVIENLKQYYKLYNCVNNYHLLVHEIIDNLDFNDKDNRWINSKLINDGLEYLNQDILEVMLKGLSVLEFTILGCILNTKVGTNINDDYITFNELYNGEYKKLSNSFFKNVDQAKKPLTIRALQHLLLLGIIKTQPRAMDSGDFPKFKIAVDPDSILNAARNRNDLPTVIVKYITEWLT
ncbi:hypothetical protein RB653_009913 [Dictyostelium firmibasis]|uniref:Origin recognition complex subunit 4 n=1 Tax=Dictyostelium firmibasis TaxID=79012 RepID=A0AAN7TSD3_9MYCE